MKKDVAHTFILALGRHRPTCETLSKNILSKEEQGWKYVCILILNETTKGTVNVQGNSKTMKSKTFISMLKISVFSCKTHENSVLSVKDHTLCVCVCVFPI